MSEVSDAFDRYLCIDIAKSCKRAIKKGDWFIYEDPQSDTGWSEPVLNIVDFNLKDGVKIEYEPKLGYGKNVLCWSVANCREYLREKGYRVKTDEFPDNTYPFMVTCYGHKEEKAFTRYGATLISACLNAVYYAVVVHEGGVKDEF